MSDIFKEFQQYCFDYVDEENPNEYVDEVGFLFENLFDGECVCEFDLSDRDPINTITYTNFCRGLEKLNKYRMKQNKPPYTGDETKTLFSGINKRKSCYIANIIFSQYITLTEMRILFSKYYYWWSMEKYMCVKKMYESYNLNADGMITVEEFDNKSLWPRMNKADFEDSVISFGEFKRYFMNQSSKYPNDKTFAKYIREVCNLT